MSYDLLIKNGTVVDGTGSRPRMADVAVKDGMIAEIGKVKDGAKKTIDADGLIVAPGFVDPHTHYNFPAKSRSREFYFPAPSASEDRSGSYKAPWIRRICPFWPVRRLPNL
jgi:imidazolonepropionase-like amidohydrolase